MKQLRRKDLRKFELHETLLAFDFDGTLSPIVRKPDWARTSAELLPLLKRLSRAGATIAVITGRSIENVRPLLKFEPDFLVGNHGMEGLEAFQVRAIRARAVCRRWMKDLKKNWPRDPGVFLEDKRESLSFHYREARHRASARRELEELISNLHPKPRVIGGKLLFNVIPRGSPHKGSALKEVMRITHLRRAIFIGDDDTDEDAFVQRGRILSVRVGRTPRSAAKFYIRGQSEMARLLKMMGA